MKPLGFDNRICYEREVSRKQNIHRTKIKNIQSTAKSKYKYGLDNSLPDNFNQRHSNPKKQQMDREKYQKIADENQLLASRIHKIYTHGEKNGNSIGRTTRMGLNSSSIVTAREFLPGLRIDKNQNPVVDCQLSRESMSRGGAYAKPSLNVEFRKRENARIQAENAKIVKRLDEKRSCYSVVGWEKQHIAKTQLSKHMHHDGTIGYLIPKKAKKRLTSGRTLHAQDDELVAEASKLSEKHNIHRLSTLQMKKPLAIKRRNSSRSHHHVKMQNCALFQATTCKGVELTIEENQISAISQDGKTQEGTRSFTIRAMYDDQKCKKDINFAWIQALVFQLGNKKIMRKMCKLRHIRTVGLVPRISTLLNNEELHDLLVLMGQSVAMNTNADGQIQMTLNSLSHKKLHEFLENESAIRIQSVCRGKTVRLQLERKRNEHRCATKIQSIVRGRMSRNRSALLRQTAVHFDKLNNIKQGSIATALRSSSSNNTAVLRNMSTSEKKRQFREVFNSWSAKSGILFRTASKLDSTLCFFQISALIECGRIEVCGMDPKLNSRFVAMFTTEELVNHAIAKNCQMDGNLFQNVLNSVAFPPVREWI